MVLENGKALVLMSAVVPTTGHVDIINFAQNLPTVSTVEVVICGRTTEPFNLLDRVVAIQDSIATIPYKAVNVNWILEDDAPSDDTTDGYWDWWKEAVRKFGSFQYVVASEFYGNKLASILDADFIPYDLDRRINQICGSQVRRLLAWDWGLILPTYRRNRLTLKATVFGQESVGKSSVATYISDTHDTNVQGVFEYARPYLTTVGSDLSLEKMENIGIGQASLQRSVFHQANAPIILLDTDLFSTVGYYGIGNFGAPPSWLIQEAIELRSDVYYLMPDHFPLVPDPLRYGGDVRESTYKYWVDILDRYNLEYVDVPPGSLYDKATFIYDDLMKRLEKLHKPIVEFRRS